MRQRESKKRKSRAPYNLSSCVRREKAGHSDVRRLAALSETEMFGVAIQDLGSQLQKKVVLWWCWEGGRFGVERWR